MQKFYSAFLALSAILFSVSVNAQRVPVPMASQPNLSYIENFNDITNWTNGFASGVGANRFGAVPINSTGTIPDGVRITTSTENFVSGTSGGVQKGTGTIMLLSTGSTDNTSSAAIDFFMDFTGVNAGTLSFDWTVINNSTGDRKGSVRVYYSINGTTFNELTSAQVLNFTNNLSPQTSGSFSSIILPTEFNNNSNARLRFYYNNGTGGTTGSRPKISIDNIQVTANEVDAAPSVSVMSGTYAAEPSTNGNFTINFSSPTTVTTELNFAFTGTASFGSDYSVSYSAGTTSSTSSTGILSVPAGTSSIIVSVNTIDDVEFEGTESVLLTLSNPTGGYTLGTASATINITDNDAPPTVSVTAGTHAAEPLQNGTFNINLSAPAPPGGVTVSYSFSGSATLGTDYTDPLNGIINIPEGISVGTITLYVIDDEILEGPETIDITLTGATSGFTLGTSTATINLLDNEIAPVPKVVINEIYGGGGNSGATYKNDFIELFNNENYAVNLNGWSVQYASATGTGNWSVTQLSGSIPAKGYYLIQQAAGNGGTADLPTPDATGNIAMAATAGKVALLKVTDLLSGSCPTGTTTGSHIVDIVGFGSTANCFEGSGPTTAPSNTASVQRKIKGFDTNDNKKDFEQINPPTPRNSVADITSPEIISTYPLPNASNLVSSFTASVTFNENIFKGEGNIILKNAAGTEIKTIDVISADIRFSGTSIYFNLQGLAYNTHYYFEITPGAIIDGSDNDFAGITDAVTWNFSTATVPPVGLINNTYSFNECNNNLPDGFTQYSEEGSVIWGCTSFGRDASNPPSGSAPNGLQINGFVNGANQINTDWLISPAFDLTGTNYPILSFWSRTAFTGSPLKLLVSTNYNGSGDPKLATWTELNGKFPGTASDVWTLSDNINLTKYKGGSVYIAFVYSSSSDDGARWTLDDINIRNDNNPPAPSLTVLTNDVQFIYVKGGETAVKEISFAGNDLVEDVMVTATSDFLVSKDGENFASSVTFNVAEANDVFSKLYIQFAPALENQNYSGTVTLSTSEAIATINIQGSSIDPAITLEVVNWNIEWFGSTLNGPRNEELQEQNVVKIMKEVNADVYGLMEIVDEAKLARVVNQLEGYAYTISDFGSHVNPFSGTNSTLEEAQKLAFVYKTSVVSVNEVRPMLSFDLNTQADAKDNPNFYSWSSGRYPYLMDADVTLGGITKNIKFVLVHAKANTAPLAQSYERRKAGADALYDSLKTLWPVQEIIMLGDFNDDLDVSITTGYTTTSWNKFTEDLAEYDALTLPLSLAGKKSTVSYNDIIDHVVVSNEMNRWYMTSTANILTEVTGLVTNYGGTTSDHYPVFSRYIYCSITAPENIVVSNDEGQCGAVVNYRFTNTQTCGTVTADIESGTFFSIGTHTVTLTSSYGDIATFIITVEDSEKPVISLCPTVPVQCYNSNNNYTIPVLIASDNCGIESLDFTISGATTRSGNGNNASGIFNLGTSTITWKITDVNGNQSSCQTTVIINSPVTSSIPDAYAINPGSNPNTVYIGYQPASSITLNATVTGGTSPYNYKWTIGSSSGRGFSNAISVTVNPKTSSTYYLNVEDVYRCVADASTKTINVIDVRCGPKNDRVSICQFNKGKWTTSCVQSKDVAGLLANGATLGSCSTTPSSVVTFAEPVMEQAAKGLHVLAMPNPSSGYFNIRIQSENNSERLFVRITDLLGRTVEQFQNIPSTHVLRIGDNYKNGVYLVEVIQGSSRKHLKIIKNQ